MIRSRNPIVALALGFILAQSILSIAKEPTDTSDASAQLLQPQLDSMKAQFMGRAPKQTIDLFDGSINTLRASGIEERALSVNDTAPAFSLMNADGDSVALATLLESGPVVVTWYRGGWCPYCNTTLRAWMNHVPELTALGVQLVAISPEVPDSSMSTKERLALTFEVLSDPGNRVARNFGLVYKLSDSLMATYNQFFTLSAYNGNDANELPLAATYIIGQNRVIQYAFVDADYKVRAEPSEVIAALHRLRGGK